LSRAGRYKEIAPNLRVKQVMVGEHRYVVCHNPVEAEHDRQTREAVVARLRDQVVGQSPKKAIPHRGYRRYLDIAGASVALNEAAIEAEARYDGKYVLRTSTNWTTEQIALAY